MKLINLNLWKQGNLFSNITKMIRREDPAIFVAQEVSLGLSYPIIKSLFPYGHFSPRFTQDGETWGNAIFSHFEIHHPETHFYLGEFGEFSSDRKDYENEPRSIQLVNTAGFYVCNNHGVWSSDNPNDSEVRWNMINFILEHTPKHPTVVCGDFNVATYSECMRKLAREYLNRHNLETSFNMLHKPPLFRNFAVDVILTSPKVRVFDAFVLPDDVSDHLAIGVEL